MTRSIVFQTPVSAYRYYKSLLEKTDKGSAYLWFFSYFIWLNFYLQKEVVLTKEDSAERPRNNWFNSEWKYL